MPLSQPPGVRVTVQLAGQALASVIPQPAAAPPTPAPLYPLTQPVDGSRRLRLPPRGIVRGIAGAALAVSVLGPPVTPLHGPVHSARPLPPAGKVITRTGTYSGTGPAVTPLRHPVAAVGPCCRVAGSSAVRAPSAGPARVSSSSGARLPRRCARLPPRGVAAIHPAPGCSAEPGPRLSRSSGRSPRRYGLSRHAARSSPARVCSPAKAPRSRRCGIRSPPQCCPCPGGPGHHPYWRLRGEGPAVRGAQGAGAGGSPYGSRPGVPSPCASCRWPHQSPARRSTRCTTPVRAALPAPRQHGHTEARPAPTPARPRARAPGCPRQSPPAAPRARHHDQPHRDVQRPRPRHRAAAPPVRASQPVRAPGPGRSSRPLPAAAHFRAPPP